MVQIELNSAVYRLHHDGRLDVTQPNGQRVQLEATVTFGLLSVLATWPGVRGVLTAAEKERQRIAGDGNEAA